MRDLIITAAFFGAIPLVFTRPWTGILLFSWISYMNPHRLTYGFAFSFQFALIAALVTMIAFALGQKDKKVPMTPVTVMLIVFILWVTITTIAALAPEGATEQYTKFVKIQMMIFLTLAMIKSREQINWLVIVIVCSIGFYGVRGGIFSILTGGNFRVWGPPGSFFEDNNSLALTLIMTLPMMHYLQLLSDNRWVRHLLSIVMLLTLGAIIGTYSRGALVALTAMGISLWLRSSKKIPVGIAAAICVVGVLSFMPQQWFDRMDTIKSYDEDQSASGRFDSWLFAINVANDRVLGGGFKLNQNHALWPIYNPDAFKPRSMHSIYFEVLGEHGWTGLFIFLTMGLTAFLTCSRTYKLSRKRPDLKWAGDLSKMLQVSIIGYAAAGTFLNLATFDLFYHLLTLIVAARVIVSKELANEQKREFNEYSKIDNGAQSTPETEETSPHNTETNRDPNLGGASGYLIKRR
jgi:putative inorganic carbon (HCO3(-)) transporter